MLLRQAHHQNIYLDDKLAVLKALCLTVIASSHSVWGHIGQKRTLVELKPKYAFGPRLNLTGMVKHVVGGCHVCQVSEPPNWRIKGPMDATPVIEGPMTSVCMDVVSMPKSKWNGQQHDAMLL